MKAEQEFPLTPPLPLPKGVDEIELFNWLCSTKPADAPDDISNYCRQDFRRFIYTLGLVEKFGKNDGKCLELGANPYFTTMLLREFTKLELILANYFGPSHSDGTFSQKVIQPTTNPRTKNSALIELQYQHFNIEESAFPYADSSFDIILFCEIIEHLLMNPIAVLKEIRRTLKPNGLLIITTPNVSRLENVARLLSGENIYDPYSGYGPYGRHNREYNKHELNLLLKHIGFTITEMFSADVHENIANSLFDIGKFSDLIKFRQEDLGQYIFLAATPSHEAQTKLPSWLYRSYPDGELV
jgi:SAM-dependent methyltransferase